MRPSRCSPASPFPSESWLNGRETWVGFSSTYSRHGEDVSPEKGARLLSAARRAIRGLGVKAREAPVWLLPAWIPGGLVAE